MKFWIAGLTALFVVLLVYTWHSWQAENRALSEATRSLDAVLKLPE